MKFKPTSAITMEAVQWKRENIVELQRMMLPCSPSYRVGQPHVGIWCSGSLSFADEGDWIVKFSDLPDFRIVRNAEFQQAYMPVEESQ